MFAVRMQDPKNNDSVAVDPVEDFIWETSRQQPPKTAIVNCVALRIGLQGPASPW